MTQSTPQKQKFLWMIVSMTLISLLIFMAIGSLVDKDEKLMSEASQKTVFTVKNIATIQFNHHIHFMTASTLSYFLDSDHYHAEQFQVEQYLLEQSQSPLTHLKAHALTYMMNDDVVQLSRPVRMANYTDNTTLNIITGEATYHFKNKLLTSNQPMQIQSPQGFISANGMKFDFISQSFDLFGQVHSVFTLNASQ